jgi:hypothetical protein
MKGPRRGSLPAPDGPTFNATISRCDALDRLSQLATVADRPTSLDGTGASCLIADLAFES